ncbi:hypothetical protein [Pseudanabaena mucicola]|uniref:Uncharacterized protein n=1 Tax=Pseudanabaena mucicola FACHB-723 TaxID=2692860 RepID=A0ABR7ZTU3_9CYAN|nr:hypothetical protein [Pseudanabaena mucicola]MBD2187207.1 hypothetical protein [Pseudanabaena mucicola FACHB-723]
MSQAPRGYTSRDADYYMHQIPLETLEKLSNDERDQLKSIFRNALPNTTPKIIDLRFVVDLVFTRYFVVLMIGKDRRKQQRHYEVNGVTRIANIIGAVLLIMAMSLLISAVTFLLLYLLKSSVGIDIFSGHITEVLFKKK